MRLRPLQEIVLRAAAVFTIAAVLIAIRRWPQLVSPDVWVEDGTLVIPSFVNHGWIGLFDPVAGYLVIPSKFISFVALNITFSHYAMASTILAIIAQASVIAIIAIAPTLLSAPFLAALLVVLLPTGSEVYALPSYSFWWTSLLTFVGLLWRGDRLTVARSAAILIGGLSSPIVILLFPIFFLRALISRNRTDCISFIISFFSALIQGIAVVNQHASAASPLDILRNLPMLISKYFGTALYSIDQHGAGVFGLIVISTLGLGILALPRAERFGYALLGACLLAAVLTSVLRVPVSAPHPLLAGPRYFFFPLILIGWMLLVLAVHGRRVVSLAAMFIAGAYVPSFAADFVYEPQIPKRPWSQQVAECLMSSSSFTFDIQYGLPNIPWSVTLSGDDCRKLQSNALVK